MARRLQALASPARAAVVTAAAAISISASSTGSASAAASARPVGGVLLSMSCTSARNCAAVGQLVFPHAKTWPLVVSEKGGTWGRARTVPGLSALPGGDQIAGLGSVSCSSKGNCSAGGSYQQNGSSSTAPSQALVVTERSGVWGKAKPVPGLAARNRGGSAGVDQVSCRSAGNCTASGTYYPTACYGGGGACGQVFVVSEKNGTWGKAGRIPGLAAIDHNVAQDNALSCVSPGNCTIAGSYRAAPGNEAFVASQKNGTWGPAQTFPAIAAVAADGASIDTLSCQPGGNCTGAGTYFTSDTDHVFAVSETHGTWGAARLIRGFAALPGGGVSFPADTSLSCPSAGNCTVGGTYVSKREGVQVFVATEKNGKWGPAQALPGLAALNTGQEGSIAGLACFSAGNCTAAGSYGIGSKSFIGAIFVTAEKNGKWGKPERVPGSAALGRDVNLVTLSCGAPRNCSVGGYYGGKHSAEPFLATEKNGTWGKAERVSGIQS